MTNRNKEYFAGPEMTRVDSVYVNELIQQLGAYLDFQSVPVGRRFTISADKNEHIYIFRSGVLSLSRQPDDVLIDFIEAPTIRGMIPVHEKSISQYTIRVIEQSDIAILKAEHLYQLFTEHNLWESFARHMLLISSMAVEALYKLNSHSAYEVVRLQLYELINKPQHIREGITAESYISSKTRLSRSAILRVIARLKTEGYIVVKNGILKEIKYIPLQS